MYAPRYKFLQNFSFCNENPKWLDHCGKFTVRLIRGTERESNNRHSPKNCFRKLSDYILKKLDSTYYVHSRKATKFCSVCRKSTPETLLLFRESFRAFSYHRGRISSPGGAKRAFVRRCTRSSRVFRGFTPPFFSTGEVYEAIKYAAKTSF